MAAHVVWIESKGFSRIVLAPSYRDARTIREYWERRGKAVTIARVKLDDVEPARGSR